MKTKCTGTGKPMASKVIAGHMFPACPACSRVFRKSGKNMESFAVAPRHYLGTQAYHS